MVPLIPKRSSIDHIPLVSSTHNLIEQSRERAREVIDKENQDIKLLSEAIENNDFGEVMKRIKAEIDESQPGEKNTNISYTIHKGSYVRYVINRLLQLTDKEFLSLLCRSDNHGTTQTLINLLNTPYPHRIKKEFIYLPSHILRNIRVNLIGDDTFFESTDNGIKAIERLRCDIAENTVRSDSIPYYFGRHILLY